jgi:putative component of membrane protein insertase Oxa1/YidC/SpoIIIJ protein YidD
MLLIQCLRSAICLSRCVLFSLGCVLSAFPADSTDNATSVYGTGSNILLNVYQRWISPVKGGNTCPMYPSCSQYAKILFERQSFLIAMTGTCDRLLRCGRDLESYQLVNAESGVKHYDPPEITASSGKTPAVPESPAASPVPVPSTVQPCDMKYAVVLSGMGLHGNAFQEYLRTALMCSEDSLRRAALAGAIRSAYYSMQAPELADLSRTLLPRMNGDSLLSWYFQLVLARKYCTEGEYMKALWTLRLYNGFASGNPLRNEYFFIRAIAQLRSFEWKDAAMSADSIDAASPKSVVKKRTAGLAINAPLLPHRSRSLSAVFSAVVPGAGYFYAGRPSTGIAAFLVNGLFVWSAIEMFSAHHIAAGTTVSTVGAGWYFGTIRGSASAADRFNSRVKNSYVDRLLDDLDIESCPRFEK